MNGTMDRTEITVACDMESDLHMAGMLNTYIERIEDGDETAEGDRDRYVEREYAAWARAAQRVGAERGYEVVTTDDLSARTSTPSEDEPGDTVEREIWQAAHDAAGQ